MTEKICPFIAIMIIVAAASEKTADESVKFLKGRLGCIRENCTMWAQQSTHYNQKKTGGCAFVLAVQQKLI